MQIAGKAITKNSRDTLRYLDTMHAQLRDGLQELALAPSSAAHGFKAQDDKRRPLNEFIRSSRVFDGVADFDKVVTDAQSGEMRGEFVPDNTIGHKGDKLHPNRLGDRAMGTAIDLKLPAPAPGRWAGMPVACECDLLRCALRVFVAHSRIAIWRKS